MAIVQISKIQVRIGAQTDLPQLDIGEIGFTTDYKNAYIGNDPVLDPPVGIQPTLTQLLTDSPNCHINANQLTGVLTIQVSDIKIQGGHNGYVLTTDGHGNLSWSVSGGTGAGGVSGSNTQIQFNNEGDFGSDSNLVYNLTTNTLTLTGNLIATNLAGNITTSTQTNITRVGTLKNLTVSNTGSTGNIIADNANLGNLTISNYFSGNGSLLTSVAASTATTVTASSQPNITSTGTLISLSVSGVSTLGLAGNVKIGGGNPGQLLTTDGAGNLSWTSITVSDSGSTYGNANVASYLNSGFFNTTFIGSIPKAEQSNISNIANLVTGGNVFGQVGNALIAGTVYTRAQPNITSVGTLNYLTVVSDISSTAGSITAAGNISATYLKGNGSSITGAVPNAVNLVTGGTINSTVAAVTQSTADNSTKIATTAFVKSVLQTLYPVGSVYINASDSANPNGFLGFGIWEMFSFGRVLAGFDPGDSAFDSVGKTGGIKDAVVVNHAHTATTAITDPGHAHSTFVQTQVGGTSSGPDANWWRKDSSTTGHASTGITAATTVASAGVSGANQNLPPYVVVYMWKRTA